MKKKLISLALVLCMVLSLVPTAMAAEGTGSAWHSFRGSDSNMAITDAKTPTDLETTVLKWAHPFADNKPTPQIIADNALITMSGTTLYKLDLQTGETAATGTMAAASSYTYTPPAYANGMIYCALSGGTVQAFDATTLESKWVYTDELAGQDQVPVIYSDGYVYTGFYSGKETGADANFVCLNAVTGEKAWSITAAGGFYWTAPVVIGNTMIIGTDNGAGTSGTAAIADSHVYSLNKKTGEVISDITVSGDQRSGISYSAEKGRVYFTTKAGFLCSAAVDAATGALSDVKAVDQGTASTSTPIVYGDKVYFGLSRSLNGNTTGFAVADADTLEQLYVVAMKGYPQCSFLLSTAYYATEGKLYFYSTYNANPGGLSLIKVDPTKDTADGAELVEFYNANGYSQFCISSPICGADGTIYYKNDSGAVLAVGINESYLSALSSDVGTWTTEFSADLLEYELVVPIGTTGVTFAPTGCEGSTVTVNGQPPTQAVPLTDGKATAAIVVTKGEATRTYTVTVREASASASLSELKVNENNSYTNTATAKELSPAFAADTLFYKVTTVTNNTTASFFARVWPTASDVNATVKAYAVSNVTEGKFDATTGVLTSGTNSGHTRFSVYFADITKPAVVRIEVTAEDGETVQNYMLVLSTDAAAAEADALLKGLKNQAAADAVIEKINAIGDVTLDSAEAIKTARAAYDALTQEQKAMVSNADALTAAEAKLEQLKDEATANPVDVFVTIANKGSVVMAQKEITVTDVNNNGIFDVDDALYAAHEAGYTGGAAAGYASEVTQYGLGIAKLWGDTSYAYGYWLNNASCWSLEDVVTEGDHLVAFVYTDGTNWSDSYATFEQLDYAAEEDAALSVKLEKAGYDENWNTVFSVHAGASITVYDSEMKAVEAAVTDNGDGTYAVTISDPGTYYLVASDSDPIIVPAVCQVTVAKKIEPAAPVNVYVTISKAGSVVMIREKVTVADRNVNGFIDVDDVLYAAHEAGFEGGAAAGYASAYTEWGLGISMLWGDTSYAYGYWLNNASCWSLEDTVKADDHLVAFVYADGIGWTDSYTKFDKFDFVTDVSEGLTVELEKAGYDENWNTVFSAHAGAAITLYDNSGNVLTEGYTVKDNNDGTYTVIVNAAGSYYVVAADEDPLIVPAVASLVVNKSADPTEPEDPTEPGDPTEPEDPTEPKDPTEPEKPTEPSNPESTTKPTTPADPSTPQTGDNTDIVRYTALMIASLACMAALLLASKKERGKYSR